MVDPFITAERLTCFHTVTMHGKEQHQIKLPLMGKAKQIIFASKVSLDWHWFTINRNNQEQFLSCLGILLPHTKSGMVTIPLHGLVLQTVNQEHYISITSPQGHEETDDKPFVINLHLLWVPLQHRDERETEYVLEKC